MSKYQNLLLSLAVILAGLVIAFASHMIVLYIPGWFYELFIGAALIVAGLFTAGPDIQDNVPKPILFPRRLYSNSGVFMAVVGIVVFLNIARYDEIIQMTGDWPLHVLGGWMFFNGLILLIHDLTVFGHKPK